MKNEEEFKNKLNDLIHSKEFPFDEANWEQAQKLLDETSDAPKLLNRYVVLIIAGIISLASTFAYFVSQKRQAENISHVKGNATSDIEVKNESNAVIENTEVNNATFYSVDKPSSEPKLMTKTENLVETKSSDFISTSNRSKPKPKLVNTKPLSIVEKTGNINSENETLILNTRKNTMNKNQPKAKQMIDRQEGIRKNKLRNRKYLNLETNIKTEEEDANKFQAPSIVLIKESDVALQPNENLENEILKIKEVKENKTDVYSQNSQVQDLVQAPIISSNDKTEAQNENLNNNNNTIANDHSNNQAEEVKNSNTVILPLTLDSNQNDVSKNDKAEKNKMTVSVDSALNNNKLVVRPEIRHVFSFELGTAYLMGWKDNQGLDAKGFNPIGGINYAFNFNPKFSFLTGLLYTSIGNINNTNYTAKRVKYNFGEEIDYTTISAKNMYYLTVPFKFLYRFKVKNAIGLGLNASYLLDVSSNVSTYNKRFNTLTEALVTKSNGYKGGFNKYDLQFSLFYRRRIVEKLSVHTEFNLGLLDIKKDKYFKPAQFERNTGFKLTLVYDIFNK
jgi:hypothetical protein